MLKALVVVVSLAALGSCSTLPKAEKVKTFGDAAASSSAVMRNALKANRMIAIRTSQEREAEAFLKGRRFMLATNQIDAAIILSSDDVNSVLAALGALEEYSEALALAADQGVVDRLETASVKLGEQAGSVVIAASPVAAPIVGPAFKVPARLVGFALGNQYAAEIQAVIVARDPDVQKLTQLLISQMGNINALISAQVLNYEIKRQEVLKAVRADRRLTRLELYKEYMLARADLDAITADQKVIGNYQATLQSLADAHHALATQAPDSARIIGNFVKIAEDITDVLNAIKTARGG